MRYPIKIAKGWGPLFSLFGFKADRSYVELGDDGLVVRFGAVSEAIPIADIDRVEERRWPFYYGLGAKLDTGGGVAYVGSLDGVVRVHLKAPRPIEVWGPFKRKEAHAITVSLEDADGFIEQLQGLVSAR